MLAWDDGNGPGLFVGGLFTKVGGKEIPWIARWDGKEWSPVGSGLEDVVNQMLVHDDGSGPALFVIGSFSTPSSHIAKWNGIEWLPLGADFIWPLFSMAVFDDGTGKALYVSAASKVSKWDGRSWTTWVETRIRPIWEYCSVIGRSPARRWGAGGGVSRLKG